MAVGQGAAGGAIKDPDSSQTNDGSTQANGGATSSGIGFSTTVIKDDNAKLPGGSPWGTADEAELKYDRIGGVHAIRTQYAATDVAKNAATRVRKAPAQIANGAQEATTGWYNHTGATVEAGQWYVQVQAV